MPDYKLTCPESADGAHEWVLMGTFAGCENCQAHISTAEALDRLNAAAIEIRRLEKIAASHSCCRPYEPNDRCGGCCDCLQMQADYAVAVQNAEIESLKYRLAAASNSPVPLSVVREYTSDEGGENVFNADVLRAVAEHEARKDVSDGHQ